MKVITDFQKKKKSVTFISEIMFGYIFLSLKKISEKSLDIFLEISSKKKFGNT